MASIKKNGGILYSKVLRDMLLGGEATKQIVTKITDEIYVFVLVEGSNSRVSRYQSKYVISAFDPDVHDLLY